MWIHVWLQKGATISCLQMILSSTGFQNFTFTEVFSNGIPGFLGNEGRPSKCWRDYTSILDWKQEEADVDYAEENILGSLLPL